jgi:hypothetical protein
MKVLLSHFQQNIIAYFALFVALGGTSYASVKIPQVVNSHQTAKSAKAGITCGGSCPASSVFWAYIGAKGVSSRLVDGAPAVNQTAVGGVGAQVDHNGVGDWTVYFQGQDLSNCARFAELTNDRGSASAAGYDHRNPVPQAIHVLTTDATGNPADLDFVVIAFCGHTGPTGGAKLQTSPYPPSG